MAQTPTTASLYTIVRNTSGSEKAFGFLGEHGMRLGVDEQVSIRGDLPAKLGNQHSRRQWDSFENALINGLLELISTPAPVLYDATNDKSVVLAFDDDCLGYTDPGWSESDSSDFRPPNC